MQMGRDPNVRLGLILPSNYRHFRPTWPKPTTDLAPLGVCLAGLDSRKNSSGSGSFGGAASLVELEPFCKIFGKTASLVGLML